MKTAGVIAEFDPFHNGHAFFLRRVRELTSADFIIALMSGDFTQRGKAAVAGKKLRTETALLNGADVVIELPVQYSTASAELFAMGGVAILDALQCVDVLCFGTEESDIGKLKRMAEILGHETVEYKEKLTSLLKKGMNYPAARTQALKETMPALEDEEGMEDILAGPNNILALEYLKAINKLGSVMDTVNIKREAVDHNAPDTCGVYSSGGNIRQMLQRKRSLDAVKDYLPENTLSLLKEHWEKDFPVFDDDMSSLMRYRLLVETEDSLRQYADMNEDLARRVVNKRAEFEDVTQFTGLLKTKNLTYTRISRALLHTMLSVKRDEMEQYAPAGYAGFARVLGFRAGASKLIDIMRAQSKISVITRTADHRKLPEGPFRDMFEADLRAADIYHSIVKDVYGTDMVPDISAPAYTAEYGSLCYHVL
jgi:predicted nucleotidyltransferase